MPVKWTGLACLAQAPAVWQSLDANTCCGLPIRFLPLPTPLSPSIYPPSFEAVCQPPVFFAFSLSLTSVRNDQHAGHLRSSDPQPSWIQGFLIVSALGGKLLKGGRGYLKQRHFTEIQIRGTKPEVHLRTLEGAGKLRWRGVGED